jgi:hypothetical protein
MADPQPTSSMHSLTKLPAEIITAILLNLSFQDVFSVSRVCHYLHNIVTNNATNQYHVQSQISGIIDNHHSTLSVSERLSILQASENAWLSTQCLGRKTMLVRHHPSGIYDLSAGVLLLGDKYIPDSFKYITLPSLGKPVTAWKTVKLKNIMIDMGLCLVEHGLVAVVTGCAL